MIVEKLGLEIQQWLMPFQGRSGKSYLKFKIFWKIYVNLFHDVLHFFFSSCCSVFKEHGRNNEIFRKNSRDWRNPLAQRMLNLALMVINELLMEKSLITCIKLVFRLIFSSVFMDFSGARSWNLCMFACRMEENFPIYCTTIIYWIHN